MRQIFIQLLSLIGLTIWLAIVAVNSTTYSNFETETQMKLIFFAEKVRPIFEANCYFCHSGANPKKDLNLSDLASVMKRDPEKAIIKPNDAESSLLFHMVSSKKMPPSEFSDPLSPENIEILRQWINDGAIFVGAKHSENVLPLLAVPLENNILIPQSTDKRSGLDWWSLQKVGTRQGAQQAAPLHPAVKDTDWVKNPIDCFVLAKIEAIGAQQAAPLHPAPKADKLTLIRRVTFDLTGLPPTPEEIEAFLKDNSPDAYERLVGRLLASPHYGERWARHWLDVVRFGESHGFEVDSPRDNAWRYRDYVISAFNNDKPYNQFIIEQLAGDAFYSEDPNLMAATGFLVAGPWDTIGNNLQASVLMRARTRMDELDDMVNATAATFLGLTVSCARCHDHKFDPITTKDYYRMQAVFRGVKYGDRPFVTKAQADEIAAKEALYEAQLKLAEVQISNLERPIKQRLLKEREESIKSGKVVLRPPVNSQFNEERFPPLEAKFVRFTIFATSNNSQPCIDELEIYGSDENANLALSSLGSVASASSLLPNFTIHQIHHLNDGMTGNEHSWISNEKGAGWAQIELNKPAKIQRIVWSRDRNKVYTDRTLTDYVIQASLDGKTWTPIASSSEHEVSDKNKDPISRAEVLLSMSTEQREQFHALSAKRDALLEEKQRLKTQTPLVWAANTGKVEPTYILRRGDVESPGDEVFPGTISCLSQLSPDLNLPLNADDPQRRLALAQWIANSDNPLTTRVLVNRLWQYHFGEGLVRTPSDFGFNGDRPSHPELLDWLAAYFVKNGWSIKKLHRLILMSNTYQQSSQFNEKAYQIDADNRLWWRMNRQRLDAESLRDAILAVSGQLDKTIGGPSFRLAVPRNDNIIVYDQIADDGPEHWRRSVYRFAPRTGTDPFLDTFDCPDPSVATPKRRTTTTPLQALSLLNNRFILKQADFFAQRLESNVGDDISKQVIYGYELAFGREPTAEELNNASQFVKKYGLAAFCRVLFNANEFIYVR